MLCFSDERRIVVNSKRTRNAIDDDAGVEQRDEPCQTGGVRRECGPSSSAKIKERLIQERHEGSNT